MLFKNDFNSWKVFYALSYTEIKTINLSQSSFKVNNKIRFSSSNQKKRKAANSVYSLIGIMLNTFHDSVYHTLFILYSTYTSCAIPYLSHTVIKLVFFKPSLYIMITGTILNFPNTWKIVMQIMAGSCGNFAKYKCKQITSWDKSGYKLWHQFMENLKTKPKV